jgi:formate dehydrogenase major subunit
MLGGAAESSTRRQTRAAFTPLADTVPQPSDFPGNGNSLMEMHVMRSRTTRSNGPAGAYPRLTQPLVRENGALRPATWDEALDRAAEGFRRNLAEHGPNATGIFSCSKSTNEVNFLAQKLARVAFGNNNIDSCNRT